MTESFVPNERPKFVEDEHLLYLDDLRETGVTNMFGAAPHLRKMYPLLTIHKSYFVLSYWMKTFGKEDR